MKINITDIKKTLAAKDEFTSEEVLQVPDLELVGPVRLHLKVNNAGTRLILQGDLQGTVKMPCARCAEECVQPLFAEIEEEFLPAGSPEVAAEQQHPWSDLNVYDEEDNFIDISEILRQNALAAQPIQPLCKEDCCGLCPICGENRNRRTCDCKDESVDPRWQGLLQIRAKHEGSV